METKQQFNKRMVQLVRRVLKETDQYKVELLQDLCKQEGFEVRGKKNQIVNVDYFLDRIEKEDIPYTFKYGVYSTYIFGDLLVYIRDARAKYFTVSLKPPIFDLTNWDSNYEPLVSYLKRVERGHYF